MGRWAMRFKKFIIISALLLAAFILIKLNTGLTGLTQQQEHEREFLETLTQAQTQVPEPELAQEQSETHTQTSYPVDPSQRNAVQESQPSPHSPAPKKDDRVIVVDKRMYYIKRKRLVTPLDFEFSIPNPPKCVRDSRPLLVAMVLTMPEHGEQRQVIRDTWGSGMWGSRGLPWDFKVVFLLGEGKNKTSSRLVRQEHAQFHDIVEAGFVESYHNLTYKVLMGFRWVGEYCIGADFVMKVDEDVFINTNRMIEILGTIDLTNAVFGPYFETGPVERTGKHGIEKQDFPLENYPPHVKGNFYVMPTGLALRLLEAAQYMPYVYIEDAHITGILVKVIGGRHVGVTTSGYSPQEKKPPEDCDFVDPFKLAAQGVSAFRARGIWKAVLGKIYCRS